MATPSKDKLIEAIRDALAVGVGEFLTAFRSTWPGESMYSFLFELPCEGTHAHAAVATEEGLTRIVESYAKKGYRPASGDATAALSVWLRWAGPEDGWFQGNDLNCFDRISTLLDEAIAFKQMEPYDGQLNRVALEALRVLDKQGTFGSRLERERIVLGMCYIGGDNSDEEFLGWAEQVNPPVVFERLQREIAESRAMGKLIPSPRRI